MLLRAAVLALLFACGSTANADELDDTYQSLKDATAKKDAALVKKLSAAASALARKAIAAPAAEGEANPADRIAYAKAIDTYAEYALYATAVQSPAATTVDLIRTLEGLNPKSKYLNQGYESYIMALSRTGAAAKIPEIAEKALANFPNNEDLLLVLADTAMQRKQSDRALAYAKRLVAALNGHGTPEGMSAADWERKKSAGLGRGYWIAGVLSGEKAMYVEADKNLRAALPLIKGNSAMLAAALFHLGVANYQLGVVTLNRAQVIQGANFSEEASKIEGPYQEQAWKNVYAMKQQAAKMR
jgi:hypothetical protein